MPHAQPTFPVDTAIPPLLEALRTTGSAILSAPPGAGKTTRVPPAISEDLPRSAGRVLMLEPRRLAARRAAEYMAACAGEQTGQTFGYRIRGEARTSPRTRVEIVTEGILTRMIQHAPDLPEVSVLIFDEFHERSIHADLGLAMALDVKAHLRPDLRIVVMSATLDGVGLQRIMPDAPVIRSEGRLFPVETVYRSHPVEGPLEPAVAATVRRALAEAEGDILVFLPGRRELHRCRTVLQDGGLPEGVHCHLLHGDAPRADQHAALNPAPHGGRKIILATSVAETSLTIDGVRIVVDSGFARVPRFDPRRGMAGLVTVTASRATADQRRGRAGRQATGICYRLWTAAEDEHRDSWPTPEILAADLTPLALDLARWGSPDGSGLRFLDPPPAHHLAQARSLLGELGALDGAGRLTPHGNAMAAVPVHPRLAHMILQGKELGMAGRACEIAAILEGPEPARTAAPSDCDLEGLLSTGAGARSYDSAAQSRILAETRRLRRLADAGSTDRETGPAGLLLALAFPDRIARRREDGSRRYLLANGTGALLPEWSQLARHEFLAVGEVDGAGREARIFLAAPLSREDLDRHFADAMRTTDELYWDDEMGAVVCKRVRRLGALLIAEQTVAPSGDDAVRIMLEGIRKRGPGCLPWTGEAESLRDRSEWLRRNGLAGGDWPDLSDAHLRATLEEWLAPWLNGITRLSHLDRLNVTSILRSLLGERNRQRLESLAPQALVSPAGRRITLRYDEGAQPVMAVRLQDMVGQRESPTIADGRVRVLLHLLSPAGRPLAVTSDLASFWANAYPEVRKQMRGRYPKHSWPEDPARGRG